MLRPDSDFIPGCPWQARHSWLLPCGVRATTAVGSDSPSHIAAWQHRWQREDFMRIPRPARRTRPSALWRGYCIPRSVKIFGLASWIESRLWQGEEALVVISPAALTWVRWWESDDSAE